MAENGDQSTSTTEAVERIGGAAANESQDLEDLPHENKIHIEADAKAEFAFLEIEQKRQQINLQKAGVENYKQDITLRQEYSKKLFRLLLGWTLGLWGFLLLQGFKPCGFEVDSKVALGVVINVTVAVVGLFLVVTKNLFPSRDSSEPKNT